MIFVKESRIFILNSSKKNNHYKQIEKYKKHKPKSCKPSVALYPIQDAAAVAAVVPVFLADFAEHQMIEPKVKLTWNIILDKKERNQGEYLTQPENNGNIEAL